MEDLACPPIAPWPARSGDVQFSHIFDQINAGAEGKPIKVVNPGALAHARSRP
jgi:hypothetical protein